MNNNTISAFDEMPSVSSLPAALAWEAAECCEGARRRSSNDSGTRVTTQITPTQICVARQPSVAMKCWISGGQITPER